MLDKIRVSKSTKTSSRSPLSRSERTSVGAGSPQPVPMIGAAWGEKEKLDRRS